MARILVLYDSATGNVKKMAQYVANGAEKIPGMEIRLLSVDQATREDVKWCDGIAVGSPTNMGILSWKMKQFWDVEMQDLWHKIDGKIGCAFSSSGGWGGGAELTCQSLATVLMNFGFLIFGIPDYVADQFTLHYGAIVAGEPRADRELAACQKLGERLAQWVAYYVEGRADMFPLKNQDA